MVLVVGAFVVCTDVGTQETAGDGRLGADDSKPRKARREFLPCDRDLPFEPTYFPPPVSRKLECPDPKLGLPQGIAHYGPEEKQIQIYRGRGPFIQTNKRPIEVLGAQGAIGWIHEGFSVAFRFEGERYAIYTYGNPLNELRRFAEGLQPR